MTTHTLITEAHASTHYRTGEPTISHHVRCSCRWQLNYLPGNLADAHARHAEHVASVTSISVAPLSAGDRVQFDGKKGWWLVRATACGGRYAIATRRTRGGKKHPEGRLVYTIIDRLKGIRGALDVVGHGIALRSEVGPDTGIDDTVMSLEGRPSLYDIETYGDDPDSFTSPGEVSHRNWVYLNLTGHQSAKEPVDRA